MALTEEPRSPGRLAREVAGVLVHYAGAQIRICLILSAVYAVGFALLRVPLWPLMALLVGFGQAIPVFGGAVAVLIVAGITWAATGPYPAMGVLGIFAAAQLLESFWLTPRIMGHRLNLPPWWVFLGVLAASAMFGFVGVLLAVPAMAVIMVVYRFLKPPAATPDAAPPPDPTQPPAAPESHRQPTPPAPTPEAPLPRSGHPPGPPRA